MNSEPNQNASVHKLLNQTFFYHCERIYIVRLQALLTADGSTWPYHNNLSLRKTQQWKRRSQDQRGIVHSGCQDWTDAFRLARYKFDMEHRSITIRVIRMLICETISTSKVFIRLYRFCTISTANESIGNS